MSSCHDQYLSLREPSLRQCHRITYLLHEPVEPLLGPLLVRIDVALEPKLVVEFGASFAVAPKHDVLISGVASAKYLMPDCTKEEVLLYSLPVAMREESTVRNGTKTALLAPAAAR